MNTRGFDTLRKKGTRSPDLSRRPARPCWLPIEPRSHALAWKRSSCRSAACSRSMASLPCSRVETFGLVLTLPRGNVLRAAPRRADGQCGKSSASFPRSRVGTYLVPLRGVLTMASFPRSRVGTHFVPLRGVLTSGLVPTLPRGNVPGAAPRRADGQSGKSFPARAFNSVQCSCPRSHAPAWERTSCRSAAC